MLIFSPLIPFAKKLAEAMAPVLVDQLKKAFQKRATRIHFATAVLKAIDRLSRDDPDNAVLVAGLFDETFLVSGGGARVLAQFLNQRGKDIDPLELAKAWQERYKIPEAWLDRGTAAAARFLALLREELKPLDQFSKYFDQGSWDTTAVATVDTAKATQQSLDIQIRQAIVQSLDLYLAAAEDVLQAGKVAVGVRRESGTAILPPEADDHRHDADLGLHRAEIQLQLMVLPYLDAGQCAALNELEGAFEELLLEPYDELTQASSLTESERHLAVLQEGERSLRDKIRQLVTALA